MVCPASGSLIFSHFHVPKQVKEMYTSDHDPAVPLAFVGLIISVCDSWVGKLSMPYKIHVAQHFRLPSFSTKQSWTAATQ